EENVVLPLTIAGEKPEREWREELLKTVGLADRRSHRPAELSGGQQQRVAVARALIARPTVMVTHDPRAAAIADRVLFLADGLIVRDMACAEPSDVISAMEELSTA